MRIHKIYTIFRKEMDEIMRSKYVLFSIIGMPFIFAIFMPASSVLPMMTSSPEDFESDSEDLGFLSKYEFTSDWNQLNGFQQFFIIMVEFSVMMFLLLPMILPTVIAADTFAGERDRGTAEGMVAAPLTDTEIYLGKISGTMIPTILSLWLSAIPFLIIINYASKDILNRYYLPNLTFIGSLLFLGPLIGLASTNAMIWVSTRTTSSRDAQQLGSLVVLPLFLFFIAPFSIALIISPILILVAILMLLVIDFFLIKMGIHLLDREKWVVGS